MRFRIGLYGVIVNLCLVIYNLPLYIFGIYDSMAFILVGSSLILLSSFIVYFFLIPLYLQRRRNVERALLVIDVLIGILAEGLIYIVACTFYSLGISIMGLAEGMTGVFSGFMIGIVIYVMSFLPGLESQLLLLGAASGFIGWYILRKRTI